jgi:hypothetical protein
MQHAPQWRPCGAGFSGRAASAEQAAPAPELGDATAAPRDEEICSSKAHKAISAKNFLAPFRSNDKRRNGLIIHQLNHTANAGRHLCIEGRPETELGNGAAAL